ncbi:MAG: tetratricopeptide repeat protein [Planctomycetota bacterium]
MFDNDASNTAGGAVDRRHRRWLCAVMYVFGGTIAVVLAFAAHAPSLERGEFILDDEMSIVRKESWYRNVPDVGAFLEQAFDRPVVAATILAQTRSIPGGTLREHVTTYRQFNIGVHIAVTLMLLLVVALALQRMKLPPHAAALSSIVTACLFAAHPLTTNVVAYPVQRAESMFALALLGVLASLHVAARRWWVGGPLAVLSAAAGMLCKSMMIGAAPIALIYDRAVLTGSWKQTLRARWWLHCLLFATWGLLVWPTRQLRFLTTPSDDPARSLSAGFNVPGVSSWEYLRTQPEVVLHYFGLTFWPVGLALDRAWPISEDLAADITLGVLLAGIAVASLGLAAFARRTALRLCGVGILSIFVVLAPTSSFIPIRDLSFEHRFYLPLGAVIAVVCGCVAGLVAMRKGWLGPTLAISLALATGVALTVRARAESAAWQSKIALLSRDVVQSPHNLRLHVNLAVAYMGDGRRDKAEPHLKEALRIDPNHPFANYNYSVILRSKGDIDGAIAHLAKSAPLLPGPYGFEELGRLLRRDGRAEQAVVIFAQLERQYPESPRVLANLGNALSDVGEFARAAEVYRRASIHAEERFDFTTASSAAYNLGNMLFRLGRYEQAATAYERCLEINPRHPRAATWLEESRRRTAPPVLEDDSTP